jgi:hypothetical protein
MFNLHRAGKCVIILLYTHLPGNVAANAAAKEEDSLIKIGIVEPVWP